MMLNIILRKSPSRYGEFSVMLTNFCMGVEFVRDAGFFHGKLN